MEAPGWRLFGVGAALLTYMTALKEKNLFS